MASPIVPDPVYHSATLLLQQYPVRQVGLNRLLAFTYLIPTLVAFAQGVTQFQSVLVRSTGDHIDLGRSVSHFQPTVADSKGSIVNRQQVEQAFIAYLSQSYNLFEAESLAQLGVAGGLTYYRKGDLLIRQGEPAPTLFFLATGLTRYVSVSPDGKEFTQSFIASPSVAGSTRAMVHQTPALFSIEALSDCICLEFEWQTFFQQMKSYPGFLETYAHLLESLFIGKEERENAFVQQSAEQRYLHFIHRNAELVDKIPLQHIASYIGITPVALSRIRKKLR